MRDEIYSASLRPSTDLGTVSVTVKKPAEPEVEPEPMTDDERMIEAGFRLVRGAWRRR
jgi:hypothetical protein